MAEKRVSPSCPVCDEAMPERSARCVRCQTKLEDWWPLDEALRGAGGPEGGWGWKALGFLTAAALGALMGLGWQAKDFVRVAVMPPPEISKRSFGSSALAPQRYSMLAEDPSG